MSSYILLMIIGAAVSFLAFSIKNKYNKFSQHVEKVNGKLEEYELVKKNNNQRKIPVASFVTKAGVSITQKSEGSFFSTSTKKGAPVVVYYNSDNPKEIMIQGKKFGLMYTVLMIGGAVFCLTGLLLLLNYEDIIHILKK